MIADPKGVFRSGSGISRGLGYTSVFDLRSGPCVSGHSPACNFRIGRDPLDDASEMSESGKPTYGQVVGDSHDQRFSGILIIEIEIDKPEPVKPLGRVAMSSRSVDIIKDQQEHQPEDNRRWYGNIAVDP